jgi:hypothetical protein
MPMPGRLPISTPTATCTWFVAWWWWWWCGDHVDPMTTTPRGGGGLHSTSHEVKVPLRCRAARVID